MNTTGNFCRRTATGLAAMMLMGSAALAGENAPWPQFAGPDRNFVVPAPKLAESWPAEGPATLWKRELGPGNASIVADGNGRLYTGYRDGEEDVIVALDAKTGKDVWSFRYASPTQDGQVLDFGKGPNTTPLLVGDRLVTISFCGLMHCLKLSDGSVLWKHDLIKEFGAEALKFGYAASPLLYKGNIVTLVGGEQAAVIAFKPEDGAVAWKSKPGGISYASPILINVDGEDQFVYCSPEEVVGISATDAERRWSYPHVNRYKNNCSTPIWGEDNLLFVATQADGGSRVLKLSRSAGETKVEPLWDKKDIKVFYWNALREGDYIYAAFGDRVTTLGAVNVRTGEMNWRERGYPKANCLLADGKLIALDEEGKLALVKASPEGMKALAEAQILEKTAWTAPTLIGTTLYARDLKHIVALDLGPKPKM